MSEISLQQLDDYVNKLIDAKINNAMTQINKTIDGKLFNWAGTAIPLNANLDNYTTPGVYNCAANATVQTLINPPPSLNAFVMFVLPMSPTMTTTGSFQTQFVITFTGKIHIRYYGDWDPAGWKEWQTIDPVKA